MISSVRGGLGVTLRDVRLRAPAAGSAPAQATRPATAPTAGRTELLAGISLDIRPGEWIALIGPNGAGKSLLMQAIAGLREVTSGRIERDGPAPVGLVFQRPDDQIVGSTVERDLAFGLENACVEPSEIRRRVDEALAWARLESARQRPPHLLSEGEKQRLALASALIRRPGLLLLDEPTSRLDPTARAHFLDSVARDRSERGTTIVQSTHHQRDLHHVDRVVALAEGRVVFDGPPSERPSSLRLLGDFPPAAAAAPVVPTSSPEPPDPPDSPDSPDPPDSTQPPATSEPIVRLSGVSVLADTAPRPLLQGISLELTANERLGVVGDSGAGKTTLLSVAAGLLLPTTGTVVHAGNDRSRVGLVFQEAERAFFEPTVLEDVMFGARNRGLSEPDARTAAELALTQAGLDPGSFGGRSPETLSGGEARRAAIAGILVNDPALMLFDEPTTGLDVDGFDSLHGLLDDLANRGRGFVIASHEREWLASRVPVLLMLAEGRRA